MIDVIDHGERLLSYGVFDDAVIATTVEVMGQLSKLDTPEKVYAKAGITEGQIHSWQNNSYQPTEIVDRRPSLEATRPLLAHLGIVNPLDGNNLYHLSALALAFPDTRIVAAGNPAGPGYDSGKLSDVQRSRVIYGDLAPLAAPITGYLLDSRTVPEEADQTAFSFGNERLLAVARHASFPVRKNVSIEPTSAVEQSIVHLGWRSIKADSALKGYVADNQLPAFEAARKKSVGGISATLGSIRPTSFAYSRGMALGRYEVNLNDALKLNPNMEVTIAHGSKSEFDQDGMVSTIAERQGLIFPGRVRDQVLKAGRHMMVNYLPLDLAINLQALSAA
jgi:hypothetical protein